MALYISLFYSYFQEVLGSSLLKSDDTEIQLHQDGSWSTPGLRSEAQILDTPSKPVSKVEVISDDVGKYYHTPHNTFRQAYVTYFSFYTELISDDVKPVKSDLSPAPEEQPTSTSNSETVSLRVLLVASINLLNLWIINVVYQLLAG